MKSPPNLAAGAASLRYGRLSNRASVAEHLHVLCGPMRVRLALIVLIAAVPLLMLSATITLQNYHLALNVTAQTASRLRESASARHVAAIAGAQEIMQALSQMAELTGDDLNGCHDRLANILALQSARYSNIAVFAVDGSVQCSARAIPAELLQPSLASTASLFATARARRDLALGPIHLSPLTGHNVIQAAYPVLRGADVAGFVYAGLRIDWFLDPNGTQNSHLQALWLVDSLHHVVQVSGTGQAGLPSAGILAGLEAAPEVIDALSAGGAHYAYASAGLGDGYSLVVAFPANTDRAAARDLLIRRLGQLGLLLLLGLAAVAVGTHLALVEPMSRLSHAVSAWREGSTFDPDLTPDPPTEVRDLATSFAQATASLTEHAVRHQAAVEQQNLAMREIHHRVKNNLQIVASLLNLQSSRIRLPEARAEFASARDRVRALATLHRHLYLQGEVHTIDMPAFLKELCGQLFQAMGETAGRRIKLIIEASPLQMNSDQAVPLSLIVTEAVSNAVKYAFPNGRPGTVRVCLGGDGDTADLVIEDDGVGIPAGKTETETGTRDGIGITLIRGFARQLQATLTVQEDQGTRYAVHFPLNQVIEVADG